MRLAQIYSHLNGLEFLKVHRPGLWKEIEDVIALVDAEVCRTKETKEARKKKASADGLLHSPIAMNAAFKVALNERGWAEERYSYFVSQDARLIRRVQGMAAADQRREIEAAGLQAISTYNQTDFVKDRVAVEVQFGKYSFVAYDLFVKHMAFFCRR